LFYWQNNHSYPTDTAMQDLNDLYYFAQVAAHGSFSAASRALGLPKSRLSRRIADLEARLGLRLLQRTTRSLSLTEVGRAYLAHCETLSEAAEAAADTIAHVHAQPRGLLHMSCPVTLAQTVIAPLLPQYLAQYPLVRIDMQVTNRVVNVVEEGLDLALRVRTDLQDSASLVVKRLGLGRQYLVAAPHLLAQKPPLTEPQQLQSWDYLAMSSTDGYSRLMLVGPQSRTADLQWQPRLVADDLLTLKFAAVAGLGICWLPDYLCEAEITAQTLTRLLPQWRLPEGIVHAVFPSRRGLSPTVRSMLDFLEAHIPHQPATALHPKTRDTSHTSDSTP